MENTYNISEAFISKMKRNYLYMMICIPLGIIAMGSIIFFEYLKGLPVSDLISGAMAIWMLFFKPVSKAQGKRFRVLEIIIGLVLAICVAIPYLLH